MGGGDVIRQALRGGYVEELSITIARVVLGGGKRLFDDFDETDDPRAGARDRVAVRDAHHVPHRAMTEFAGKQDAMEGRPPCPCR
jgi:dihydrofolate reductase